MLTIEASRDPRTMLLRNTERYREVLDIGVDRTPMRRVLTEREPDIAANGWFFDHGDSVFGLGVSDGALMILLNGQLFPYDPGIATHLLDKGATRVFTATQCDVVLACEEYRPKMRSFESWFEMEDEEDRDGFLWLHKVLASPERRAVLIENNKG